MCDQIRPAGKIQDIAIVNRQMSSQKTSHMPCLQETSLAILFFALCFFVVCPGRSVSWGQTDVLTQHNDNSRSGLNSTETILTPSNVNKNTFGKLFAHSVDGIIVGQPLYASNVLMNDGHTHNVVYVATQHNSVYAFDADNILGNNASPLWSVSLDDGGTTDPIADFGCASTHYTEIGAMGTAVIDPGKTTLYIVAKTVTGTTRNFSLHALDITSGTERLGGPVIITGTAPSSNGSGTFNPIYQMQRPALLLQNNVLYIGFGGNGCDVYAYNGWFFAYNSQTLQQESAFLVTPDGTRASIWQGGSGPAVDEFGNIYVVTANGTYDGPVGGNDFGDSVLKMGWTGNTFGVLDYFTPYNQLQLSQQDLDLGSSGALILPDQPGLYSHELVAGGKQGTLYLVNRDSLGQFNANTDTVVQSIPGAVIGELAGVPSYWNGNVYVAGDLDFIKQFQLVNGLLTLQPVSQTSVSFGGAGPASTSITSNGNTSAILWAIRHTNPALFAFDPTNLAKEFYDSTQALKARDKMVPVVRFVTPTISNGKVFVGGTSALEAYGLLPTLAAATGNNQTGTEKVVLPVPLTVLASDSYTTKPIPGVSIICEDGGAGGLFTPKEAQTTDVNGHVVYTYQLPGKPRAVSIACTSVGFVSAAFSETVTVGAPTHMAIASGNNQTALPNTPLGAPLVIKVYDAHSYGVPGVTVSLTDNGAGGSFSSTSIVSDSTGTVTANYTTGPNAGVVVITVSAPGLKSLKVGVTVQ
ncbi:MAG TPA: carboxypeptidase-like regulatory domain-containing protein [Terriglobales bacterium]|nr:carboxypeptidase-like regulatory domain-containing protein [Terriglobales bacterium]